MERHGIEVRPPKISDETMREMAKFFMKTSVPRLLEEERKKQSQTDDNVTHP